MGRYKFAVVSGVILSTALAACSSNSPQSPVSPGATTEQAVGPNGETLKISAPTTQAPAGGVQATGGLILVVGNVAGTHASFPVTYRYEVRSTAGAVVATGTAAAAGGPSTSIPVNATLPFDTPHTWRARAEYSGAVGPWSGDAAFRSSAGGYIRGSEVFDPMTPGTTAGIVNGPVTFVPNVGIRLDTAGSYVVYELPVTLQEGEFSFMGTNIDEGNPGDKSKVMSMAEGYGDVTDNDYRQTLEVRGSDYQGPSGTVSYRIITGDAREEFHRIADAPRDTVSWVRSNWYFFKMWWRTGTAGFEIREGSPNGPMVAGSTIGTSGHPYRPTPHVAYLGSPNTRAGLPNATHTGMTVKNVWISGAPRPKFPGE